jgi:hypothetical protein
MASNGFTSTLLASEEKFRSGQSIPVGEILQPLPMIPHDGKIQRATILRTLTAKAPITVIRTGERRHHDQSPPADRMRKDSL